MISKMNKKLLKEEEMLVRLHISLKKYERNKDDCEQIQKSLSDIRTEMTKSACEMQHNAVVLEETTEQLDARRMYLHNLQKEISLAEQEHEMLQALIYSKEMNLPVQTVNSYTHYNPYYTKELNTLV